MWVAMAGSGGGFGDEGEEIAFEEIAVSDDECDSLMRDRCTRKIIKNKDHQFLVVEPNGSLKFEYRNDVSDDSCFLFQMYKNNCQSTPRGVAIIIHVLLNEQQCVLSCVEEGNQKYVYAKQPESPLPDIIEDSQHEAVFFLQRVRPPVVIPGRGEQYGKYKLESAKWPNWYFSFRGVAEVTEPVLSKVTDDIVNEQIEVSIMSPTS
ncbi:uncharacterized protein LOC118235124 isoform X1 [Anguilla anguilla]|uniref:uncharacterized protein LOC118235124 isoform X1 n=1 Tax=Anguilla anguilla TaxID=7936 RepID=UPI0015AE13FF|nr:uncharacterized protein LOC118235124 isoform X1 [Anguilla anguilla]